MANNREKQQSLSNSANISLTNSRQAAGSADNPPITLSRENAFRKNKKGSLDNVLANIVSIIMKESKAHPDLLKEHAMPLRLSIGRMSFAKTKRATSIMHEPTPFQKQWKSQKHTKDLLKEHTTPLQPSVGKTPFAKIEKVILIIPLSTLFQN